jgi:hypothetical protein
VDDATYFNYPEWIFEVNVVQFVVHVRVTRDRDTLNQSKIVVGPSKTDNHCQNDQCNQEPH